GAGVLRAERLGTGRRARSRVHKVVPAGAGLGGGSADAAVTLLLLARLWEAPASERDLSDLASRLGSDVPYFLTGGEANVGGRGEEVIAREDGQSRELALLVPPFSLSTAEVYGDYDREFGPAGLPIPRRLEIETSGRFFGPNDLALPVLRSHSEMSAYLRSAEEIAPEHAMSGSGSAIAMTGLSHDGEEELVRRHPEARVLRCRTLGREEYRRHIQPSGGPSWR